LRGEPPHGRTVPPGIAVYYSDGRPQLYAPRIEPSC
jgi:hypothetical protein